MAIIVAKSFVVHIWYLVHTTRCIVNIYNSNITVLSQRVTHRCVVDVFEPALDITMNVQRNVERKYFFKMLKKTWSANFQANHEINWY